MRNRLEYLRNMCHTNPQGSGVAVTTIHWFGWEEDDHADDTAESMAAKINSDIDALIALAKVAESFRHCDYGSEPIDELLRALRELE